MAFQDEDNIDDHVIVENKKNIKDADDDSSSSTSTSSSGGEQIRVSFQLSSECTNDSLKVPTQPIAVPASIGRKGLQAVINHLLDRKIDNKEKDEESDDEEDDDDRLPALSFDFMVISGNKQQQRLLRTGLEREVRRYGLSFEDAIPITYFPTHNAPQHEGESEPLPDWIQTMSFIQNNDQNNILVTGCYDGSLHIFQQHLDGLTKVIAPRQAHSGPIKCLSTTAIGNDDILIASGSMDHSLVIHEFDSKLKKLKLYANCKSGHQSAIGGVDWFVRNDGSKNLLASSEWDGGLCIWDITKNELKDSREDNVDEGASKKAKTGQSTSRKLQQDKALTLSPIISIQAHASQISGVSWGNYEKYITNNNNSSPQLTTGSWDHSLKVWDIEHQDCIVTLNGSRVISCLDTSYYTSNVVATGHPDCTVRLWDTRVAINHTKDADASKESPGLQQVVSDNIFRPSHKAWVSALQWSRHNPYHLTSTSHDGTIKLWDIRSSLPLHTVKAFGNNSSADKKGKKSKHKGMSLAYGDEASGMIYAGGTDCRIHQFRYDKQIK